MVTSSSGLSKALIFGIKGQKNTVAKTLCLSDYSRLLPLTCKRLDMKFIFY